MVTGNAQQADSVARKARKDVKRFIPTGLFVGTDIGAIGRTQFSDTFSGWEVNASTDFSRCIVSFDLGSWGRDFASGVDAYSNRGSYFRAGLDVNFMQNDPEGNLLLLGLRYGRAMFDEHIVATVDASQDPLWNGQQIIDNNNVSANWLEGDFCLRAKIWKMLWMGYTVRYKFRLRLGDTPEMIPHDVPGFGVNNEKAVWGFNYQIFIKIPIRKSEVQPKSKR